MYHPPTHIVSGGSLKYSWEKNKKTKVRERNITYILKSKEKKEKRKQDWKVHRLRNEWQNYNLMTSYQLLWQLCATTISWVGWILKDSEPFILFAENSQILLKIYVIPILLIYLVAHNLLVNNQLNSLSNSTHHCGTWLSH